jgi:tripartite-type tricarboxylate transporter receptor subunit TctC
MKPSRRTFLRLTAAAAVLPILQRTALADTYPSRPVHIIVGLAPGSASDIIARLSGQWLSQRLGQPFVTDNKSGAAGILAVETVVRSAPDGYMLLLHGAADASNAAFHDDLSFDIIRDIAPVACIASGPLVLVVNPTFTAKTVPELIAYAKANPRKVNFGSAGAGTVAHLAGELFKSMAGVDMVHVPYRGLAPALSDLIGGRVQVVFSTMPPAIKLIEAGKLHALGVTSVSRFSTLPELPSVSDFLPGYDVNIWSGLAAPKNTPIDIVQKLNRETNSSLSDTAIAAKLLELGMTPMPLTPSEFDHLRVAEVKKWTAVIKEAHLKLKT